MIVNNMDYPFGPNVTILYIDLPITNSLDLSNMSLVNIGNKSFYGCEQLVSIILPNTVAYIGENVFTGCNLTQATLPIIYTFPSNVQVNYTRLIPEKPIKTDTIELMTIFF
jgi:hypothetical protein